MAALISRRGTSHRRKAHRARNPGAAQTAVAAGILGQILLVVLLGEVERRGGKDLGRDPAVARGGRRGLVRRLRGECGVLRRIVVTVDGRAVLGSDVGALA